VALSHLRKIDKMIRMLTLNKKNEAIPREDQEKIHRLKREREECLHPVKIRITGHDKTTSRHLITGTVSTSNGLPDLSISVGKAPRGLGSDSESDPSESNSSPYEGEEEGEEEEEGDEEEDDFQEEDEISQVASTLNLLKKGCSARGV